MPRDNVFWKTRTQTNQEGLVRKQKIAVSKLQRVNKCLAGH